MLDPSSLQAPLTCQCITNAAAAPSLSNCLAQGLSGGWTSLAGTGEGIIDGLGNSTGLSSSKTCRNGANNQRELSITTNVHAADLTDACMLL